MPFLVPPNGEAFHKFIVTKKQNICKQQCTKPKNKYGPYLP